MTDSQDQLFKIDPEFKSLIPVLTAEEKAGPQEPIVSHGLLHAVTVWEETGLLSDGHNRYDICRELGRLGRSRLISLPSRKAALNWIVQNQLSRRNLTPEQKSYLRGKLYEQGKRDREANLKQNLSMGKNCPSAETTAEKLGREHKVSERTIKNDAKYAAAVDTISENKPGIRRQILSRDTKITKTDVEAVVSLPDRERAEVAARGEKAIAKKGREIREQSRSVER